MFRSTTRANPLTRWKRKPGDHGADAVILYLPAFANLLVQQPLKAAGDGPPIGHFCAKDGRTAEEQYASGACRRLVRGHAPAAGHVDVTPREIARHEEVRPGRRVGAEAPHRLG